MLTYERLRELLDYDPTTGVFRWVKPRGPRSAGAIAGSKNGRGYIQIVIDESTHQAHRLAWLYETGEWPKIIDHRNAIIDDNRIENLRNGDSSINSQNRLSASSNNKLGVLGVSFNEQKGRFQSDICHEGRSVYLGVFDTAAEAHEAYLQAKRRMHAGCLL